MHLRFNSEDTVTRISGPLITSRYSESSPVQNRRMITFTEKEVIDTASTRTPDVKSGFNSPFRYPWWGYRKPQIDKNHNYFKLINITAVD